MSAAVRSLTTFFALMWVVVLPLWMVGERLPSTLRAERVRADDWQRAMQAAPDLRQRWRAGQGPPPLLPVEGKIARRGEQVVLSGTALVPGTFAADNIALRTGYALRVEWTDRPPVDVLAPQSPLIPFLGRAPEALKVARAIELCCGITQPQQPRRQGLHVRYAESNLSVYGTDSQTPLFPPVEAYYRRDKETTRVLALTVKGNHVQVALGGKPRLDFHTTVPLTGAVGVTAVDGVLLLQRIEVTRPR